MEKARFNSKIDAFIMGGSFAMDEAFAIEALGKYLQDLSLLEAGATYAELGISDRRKSTIPTLFSFTDNLDIRTEAFTEANINSRSGLFAHLRLSGVMQLEDGLSSRGINSLVSDIRVANSNPNISGILLEVNSGGGEALSGGELMNAVKDSKKPVVVYAQRLGSAAYRGAIHANKIVLAGNDAQAGSIGAFISLPKGFADWYNENYEDIYADQSSGKNADFRGLLEGSKSEIKKVVNETARIFQNDVKRGRALNADMADETLSGGMFFAKDAKARGLVDEIGTFETAVKILAGEVRKAGQLSGTKSEDMNLLDKILGRTPEVAETPETTDETTKATPETPTPDEATNVVAAKLDAILAGQTKVETTLTDAIGAIGVVDSKVVANDSKLSALTEKLEKLEAAQAALESNQTDLEKKVVNSAAPKAGKGNSIADGLTETEKAFTGAIKFSPPAK